MIKKKDKLAIIGLGYVGLPLAVEFSKYYEVVGFDISLDRINELNNYYDRTLECDTITLQNLKNIIFTCDPIKINRFEYQKNIADQKLKYVSLKF